LAGSVALLCVVGTLFGAPSRSESRAGGLTDEDKTLLESGELVMKPKSEQRGALKLFGGQSWQVADVPIDAAWRAVQDLPSYKEIIPLATESEIKGRDGEEIDLSIRQQWGPVDITYVLQTTLDADKRAMVFRLDHSQGHELRAGWGFMRVRPWKDGKTLVSFGAMVDIGDGVLVSIIRPAVRKDLLRIPTKFKRYVEGDGRALYER
jgi:ribosome-associated toxin RatA of RatAB toxin-antitoxin module